MPERRRVTDPTAPVTFADLEDLFAKHEENERKMHDEIMSAFPNGDVKGHCDYHNSKIEAAKAEKEFWDCAKQEIMKRGVGALFHLVWIVGCLALLGMSVKYGFALPFTVPPK